MPRKAVRPHRAALTRMLRATGLAQVPEEAPLVELLRTLADEMDAGASSRARAEYLSALKDARRVLNGAGRPSGSAEVPSRSTADDVVEDEAVVPNDLARFKEARGIA